MAATSCCRSLPRCAACPVRRAAAARHRTRFEGVAAVIEDVLAGRGGRAFPPAVVDALDELHEARSPRRHA